MKILNMLYNFSNNNNRLDRKYDKYISCLKSRIQSAHVPCVATTPNSSAPANMGGVEEAGK